MQEMILFGILVSTYLVVVAKRMPALIRCFSYQSFFLFAIVLLAAFREMDAGLYIVAGLVLILKVFLIPRLLALAAKRINVDENLGLLVNSQLSLGIALALTYFSYIFSRDLGLGEQLGHQDAAIAVAFSVIFIGAFLMVSRLKAFTQVIGLLVMENGVFLLASLISGGMPFFVEIAIFFDVFVSVMVMGLFVYRINKLFTHIDVSKLSQLKG
jgi:hydrogenase-4 component E